MEPIVHGQEEDVVVYGAWYVPVLQIFKNPIKSTSHCDVRNLHQIEVSNITISFKWEAVMSSQLQIIV